MSKSIITIAVGKPVYIEMALNLAKSFVMWNENTGIEFLIVSDRLDIIRQSDIFDRISVLEVNTQNYDEGFAIKLHLDHFIKAKENIFIDCDCLIYGNLLPVFEKFKGHFVSTIGQICTEGDFFGNIEQLVKKFNLNYLPKFVGAIYYIEKGIMATNIFEYARSLKAQYDEIGLIRLRGKENEEPLVAIAMAVYNEKPIEDDGNIKADCMFYSKFRTNVLNGTAFFWNDGAPLVPSYNMLIKSCPVIGHFNASFTDSFEYEAESLRLRYFYKNRLPGFISEACVKLMKIYPGQLKAIIKNTFRPMYHLVLGYRKVKASAR